MVSRERLKYKRMISRIRIEMIIKGRMKMEGLKSIKELI